ncbi:very short patch repair endonuclease [Sphingobium sp. AS12]|uniref:very short patch repair endonuclease n=1 Tax=Sphingobium sp. AS12 TaxID=2849495 RepID=UPI001C31CA88|nr:very short patch repair endonuclease [Sphingobium sp. AS12]MBV2147690.1 very short patch repair endonuclease [Sphingobium sp. AS12]
MTTPDELRSRTMRAVRSKDTKPEMIVRKLIHGMGYRYRLHRKDLPGSPDLVFAARRRVVFVHGCFWHGHDCKRGARQPKANAEYWREKIERNRARDSRATGGLTANGWLVATIWECELGNREHLKDRLRSFLDDQA